MHTQSDRSVLLVGGPDAGKTNYLIRLWMALQSQRECLQADGLPEDVEYLADGAQALLSGAFVGHTSQEVHVRNVIPVKSLLGGKDFRGRLIVPDCSGEQWMKIHRNREWSDEWESAIPTLWGCLLFIRAGSEQIHAPLDWVSCVQMFGVPTNQQSAGTSSDNGDLQMPTQVVLIDWLQCLRQAVSARGAGSVRLRVGVVVAAWDRVPKDQQGTTPAQYVASNFPMFHDFMLSNAGRYQFECFGVSVAGGDFDLAPDFREEYLRGHPDRSGYVIHTIGGSIERSGDHTLPVAWAMGLEVRPAPAKGGHRG
jgi:Double-GTPase 1